MRGYGETPRGPRVRRAAEWLAGQVESGEDGQKERNPFDTATQYLDLGLINSYFYVQYLSYARPHPAAALDGWFQGVR